MKQSIVNQTVHCLAVGIATFAFASNVTAQVVRDGTAGPDSTVQIELNAMDVYSITEQFGERIGPENNTLLHSFLEFSILDGQAAQFSGAADIQAIISRVTGDSVSLINGELRSDISGAHFFLLNPNGVMFGASARLNVGGEFTASATDRFMFGDDQQVQVVTDGMSPILTSSVPEAFGFLDTDAGSIIVNGATIGNAAGAINLQGNEVLLQNEGVIQSLERVTVSANTIAFDDRSRIELFTSLSGDVSGGIELTATDTITMDGSSGLSTLTAIGQGTFSGADIAVSAREINLNNGARIFSTNNTDAAVHDVVLIAEEGIYLSGTTVDGNGSVIQTTTRNNLAAGSISLTAPVIALSDGADLLSQNGFGGTGNVGNISVTAPTSLTLSGNDRESGNIDQSNIQTITRAEGTAGAIEINVGSLSLEDGAKIQSSSISNADANSITIVATESVALSGLNEGSGFGSTINTSALGFDQSGTAGDISITAPQITLDDGARIDSGSVGGGDSGSITINASDSLTLIGRQENEPPEDAVEGDSRGSRIASQGFDGSTGDAGDIIVNAGNILLRNDALILSNAYQGQGGSISINAQRIVSDHSDIVSSVRDASGSGGDIVVNADLLVLGNSDIRAQAVAGNGGTINIEDVQQFVAFAGSVLDASSQTGVDGTIITPPELPLFYESDTLITEYLDVTSLLRSSCATYSDDADGTLAAKAGISASPEGLLPSFSPTSVSLQTKAFTSKADWNDLMVRGRKEQLRGDYGRSASTLASALAIAKQSKDPKQIASTLGELGNTLVVAGKRGTAEPALLEAVNLARATSDNTLLARVYNNLGNYYVVQDEPDKALNAYQSSIAAARNTVSSTSGDLLESVKAFANIVRVHLHLGQTPAMLQHLADADRIVAGISERGAEHTSVLIHLAKSYEYSAKAYPASRTSSLLKAHAYLIQAESQARVANNMKLLSYAQGNLGALYHLDGRREDGLTMARRALAAAEQGQLDESEYRWHWLEGKILLELGNTNQAIQSYQRAIRIIGSSRQGSRDRYDSTVDYFKRLVEPVYLELVDALLRAESETQVAETSVALLAQARDTIELFKTSELENYFHDECVLRLNAQRKQLDEVSEKTAVIYPIVLPNRMELLVSVPQILQTSDTALRSIKRYSIPVDASELSRHVLNFRQHVDSLSSDQILIEESQWLYQRLVQPYVSTVTSAGVNTLVFVPTGVLRLLPMAALHSGKRYLIRDFALATTTGLQLANPQPLSSTNNRVLLSGISESVGEFPALDSVPGELESIYSLYGGDVLLNDEFTVDQFTSSVRNNDYSIIHIASHAQFTGDRAGNFLRAYDKPMYFDDLGKALGTTKYRSRPLELLVLSACQTASSDERAALGLAGVGIKAGARSALASLWSIDDESAAELIEHFYTNLSEGMSKAEALQQAQRALLDQAPYTHPFYWSAFILIDNWL